MDQDLVPPSPFNRTGRVLFSLNLVALVLIWGLGIYMYMSVEGIIPTHFNFAGEPDAYGSGDMFLIMPPLLSISSIIIILISMYRFTLVNKHPYLINLPAFYAYLPKIPLEKRSYWLNKYFEAVLALGAFLALEMVLILWGIYLGVLEEVLPFWFIPAIVVMSFVMIAPLFYYFYRLSKKMKEAIIQ